MEITSSVLEHQGKIPDKYTCLGEDINPPLQFSGVPSEAKSLVLILDDPDAPMGTWVHWVVFNIPPTITEVKEGSVPDGGIEGDTSFGDPGYGGPCPPDGQHRYYFRVYALDTMLTFEHLEKMDKQHLEEKMHGHVLDHAELMGLFKK